jgi:epoxyqueuosine reductase QueG
LNRQNPQEVCPWNAPKFVQITSEEAFRPREGVHGADLIELMGMSQEEFSRRFKGSPVKRAKRRGLLRNVVAHGAGRASASGGQYCSRSSRSTDWPRRLRASRRSSGAASENRPGTLESASCTSTAMW